MAHKVPNNATARAQFAEDLDALMPHDLDVLLPLFRIIRRICLSENRALIEGLTMALAGFDAVWRSTQPEAQAPETPADVTKIDAHPRRKKGA